MKTLSGNATLLYSSIKLHHIGEINMVNIIVFFHQIMVNIACCSSVANSTKENDHY